MAESTSLPRSRRRGRAQIACLAPLMAAHFLPIPEMGADASGDRHSGEDPARLPLAGGMAGFRTVRLVERASGGSARFGASVAATGFEDPDWIRILPRIAAARLPFCGVPLEAPVLMGVVNTTPDSFSDGGRHFDPQEAALHGSRLVNAGAGIIDFGGESTRPGAEEVPAAEEIGRAVPAIERFRELCPHVPVSIDTRKAEVARRALAAGAGIVNDVSGLARDPEMLDVVLESGSFVCVMHAQGEPAEMQCSPSYRSALLDVYEWLGERLDHLEERGLPRCRIAVDPGIGFGKSFEHNIEILRGLALFHGLGCPLLVGASRKRFISRFPGGGLSDARLAGSVAAAVHAAASGVHILRVHDVVETAQALGLWRALNRNGNS